MVLRFVSIRSDDITELVELSHLVNSGSGDRKGFKRFRNDAVFFDIADYYTRFLNKLDSSEDFLSLLSDSSSDILALLHKVIESVRSATVDMLKLIESMGDTLYSIDVLIDNVFNNESADNDYYSRACEELSLLISSSQGDCFDIISILEFHDINKQKVEQIKRILNILENNGRSLLTSYDLNISPDRSLSSDMNSNSSKRVESQELIDKLINEFSK